ncbi:MAG: phenylalanine--tRNA ligase subunit alpha [Bacteroidales bacterium]|jgi:phenylalanyl-tRNA synthetase alpha chain|nr:phenylalanine--tRNA ligase subunit alpha [Bacteroidales bacterium]MBR6091583.1 phenylalanine--tRNA ligase subunit alpha [Bacteroidales bacterium]
MKEKIEKILAEVKSFHADSKEALEQFRIQYLSKKGTITELFTEFKQVAPEMRKEMGMRLNELKNTIQDIIDEQQKQFETTNEAKTDLDLTLPVDAMKGSRHPLSIVRSEIEDIFKRLGFVVAEGPEVEDDYHVFAALNFPPDHPARDMQDTFFISKEPSENKPTDVLLRTHTSSVQVRAMETNKMPIRIIAPGRVFRNEAISARAHCIFHQIEGLYIDKNVSFADLKQTLYHFVQEYFGEGTKVRFRPSYFPFTETSAEMDISCNICGGTGCNICKHTGWVEIMGCGICDPNILKASNIDPEEYTGYAFGMGVERIAMLKYQINDLRMFFENDLRFLEQFENA